MSVNLQQLGRYFLVEPLGAGGMGQVWLGYILGANGVKTPCAVKLLQADPSKDHLAHLQREAKLSSLLRHNSLAAFYEFATTDGYSYLVMEYIEGVNLHRLIVDSEVAEKPLPLEFTLHIAIQVAAGLEYLHRFEDPETGMVAEIVHGDLSPQNIMVNFEGEVKIIDLGLARMHVEMTGNSLDTHYGNIWYTSPNRIKSRRVSPSDDIFGLGILLWELATGQRYYGEAKIEMIFAELKEFTPKDPRLFRPDLPPSLVKIILHALQAETFDGYSSVSEVLLALQEELAAISPQFVPAKFREYVAKNYAVEMTQSRERKKRDLNLLASFEAHQARAKQAGTEVISPPPFKIPPKGSNEKSRDGGTQDLTEQQAKSIAAQKRKTPPQAQPRQAPQQNLAAGPNYSMLMLAMVIGLLVIAGVMFKKFKAQSERKAAPQAEQTVETDTPPKVSESQTPPPEGQTAGTGVPTETAAVASAAQNDETPVDQNFQEITVTSEPEGARIWLNGEALKQYTPARLIIDKRRSAMIKLTYKGLPDFSIIMDSSKKSLQVDLEFSAYTVQ